MPGIFAKKKVNKKQAQQNNANVNNVNNTGTNKKNNENTNDSIISNVKSLTEFFYDLLLLYCMEYLFYKVYLVLFV